ncbi:MAG: serine protease [Chloroflexi bacterium]|nr:MAG: serine protease [Chloroflexota bacterium]
MRSRTSILGIVASIALLGSVIPALAAPSPRATLAGNVPPWAKSANFKGAANASDSIGFRVYLGWNNGSAVEALAKSVSDPRSASYGNYLTAQQFRQQFAPSQAQVNAVQSWLRSQGFSIVYTPQNNHYVSAEGTIAQAAAAFGTSFGMYSVDGLTLRSPSSDISVPASIANAVTGVIGLDDVAQTVHTNNIKADPNAPPSPAFVNAPPLADYWGQLTAPYPNPYGSDALPYVPRGYTPQQINGAYGLGNTTLDGSGVSVAIIDAYASPTVQQDLDQWSSNRGMASTNITQVVAPGTYNHPERGLRQDPQGWYGEETLDVEAVHGMAPGAHIVYVGSPNNFQDLDAALNHVVDRHLASIVTNSYGFRTELLPFGFIKPYEDTILQGAIEGITINFSSGDDNDESLVVGYKTVDWPASSPFVTAVGGTSLAVGANNTYLFETGWGTTNRTWSGTAWKPASWLYGSGGGVSRLFAEPWYQVGVVQDSVFAAQGHGSGRAVPDVSALGDPQTGYLIGQTQTFFATSATPAGARYSEYRIGGTSLSSPIMAGIFALANQARSASGTAELGFANPMLYSLNGSSAVTDIVDPASTVAAVRINYNNGEDATSGTSVRLRTMNQTLSLHTTPGWDDVTGIGTPTSTFVGALSK